MIEELTQEFADLRLRTNKKKLRAHLCKDTSPMIKGWYCDKT
jgi:hypothetical protein